MAQAITASSLSSLTTLAANPPGYPRNPTEEAREPLTLYIARVPGSKDVFLTTVKPRQKVVTAEDVSSSFYYLHVDSPGHELSPEGQVDGGGLPEMGTARRMTVSRKPVPLAAEAGLGDVPPELPPRPAPNSSPGTSVDGLVDANGPTSNLTVTKRKPVRGGLQKTDGGADRIAEVKRRPLGPRPEHNWQQVTGTCSRTARTGDAEGSALQKPQLSPRTPFNPSAAGATNLHSSLDPALRAAQHRKALSEPFESTHQNLAYNSLSRVGKLDVGDASMSTRTHHRRTPSDFTDTDVRLPKKFSITVIRRDPASGGQWNVAKITSGQHADGGECASSHPSKPRNSITIEVTNPGYNRFLPSKKALVPAALATGRASLDDSDPAAAQSSNVFRRRILLDSPVSWDLGFRKRRAHSSDTPRAASGGSRLSGEYPPAERQSSDPSLLLGPAKTSDEFKATARGGGEDVKSYRFLSPWDGTCDFSTGVGGRSLKCKHTIPSASTSPGSNPSVLVSELRFNLPETTTAKAFSSKVAPSFPSGHDSASASASPTRMPRTTPSPKHPFTLPTTDSLRNKLSSQKMPPRLSDLVQASSELVQASSDRLSQSLNLNLGLGQEKAGGGFSGTRAKLGKLIVRDEGLKMLDLVVAANMGVWWRAYERGVGGE